MHGLEDKIKEFSHSVGFDAVGFCQPQLETSLSYYKSWLESGYGAEMGYLRDHLNLKASLESLLPDAKSVIAVRLNYNQPVSESKVPKVARYALGKDYHKVMRKMLKQLASEIRELVPNANFRPCVDSAPILERTIAQQAGLGWFGKNTCLIDSKTGSWFFIGLLVTNLNLESSAPAVGGCGTCQECINHCPTGAIVSHEGRWAVDSNRCISYLTIEKKGEFSSREADSIQDWLFGCDVCQEVCPFNNPSPRQPLRAALTSIDSFRNRGNGEWLQVGQEPTEVEWEAWVRGRALRRTGFQGFLRNLKAVRRNLNADPSNRP